MGRAHLTLPCLINAQSAVEAMASDFSTSPLTVSIDSTDLDLFQAIQERQVEALNLLYDRYVGLVYSLALRILNNSEEAEDVTQEVFLKFWNRSELYQPNRGSLSNFLMTMTRSRAIDKLRSRGSQFRFLQRWQVMMHHDARSDTPLDHLSMEERSHLVRSALGQLSATEREVLEIAYFEGLSQSEIAQRLGVPLGTVKSRSRQGLQKLRNALKHSL